MATRKRWTKEAIIKEATKYTTRNQFKAANESAYNAMRRLGLYDECGLGTPVRVVWSDDNLSQEARKYSQRNHFKVGNPNAYAAASRAGILDKICSNMVAPERTFNTTKWTIEALVEVCSKYTSFTLFRETETGAYAALQRKGLVAELTSHMDRKTKRFSSLNTTTQGVYIMYYEDVIVYVGKSLHVQERLGSHLLNGVKDFDKVEVLEITSILDIHVVEAYLIALHQPIYNSDMCEKSSTPLTIHIPDIDTVAHTTHNYSKGLQDSWNLQTN